MDIVGYHTLINLLINHTKNNFVEYRQFNFNLNFNFVLLLKQLFCSDFFHFLFHAIKNFFFHSIV